MKKISGVYQIQSKLKPDRIYVGSVINIGNVENIKLYKYAISLLPRSIHGTSV